MKKLLLPLVLFWSCTDNLQDIALDTGYDFYPLERSMHWLYEVEEVNFDAFGGDTTHYFLEERIGDSLIAPSGEVRYFLERYRGEDSLNMKLDSIWTVQKFQNSLVVTENNLSIVKLTFPVELGKSWNGNAYNSKDERLFYYENGTDLDEVKVVISDIPQNLVNQDERYEVYQRGVGLVRKNHITLSFCSVNCSSELGEIQSGRILKQQLISYGKR